MLVLPRYKGGTPSAENMLDDETDEPLYQRRDDTPARTHGLAPPPHLPARPPSPPAPPPGTAHTRKNQTARTLVLAS